MSESNFQTFWRHPQVHSQVWQLGLARMPAVVETTESGEKRPFRPWVVFCLSLSSGKVWTGGPAGGPERDFRPVSAALLGLAALERSRPGRIQVSDPVLCEHVEGLLSTGGISVELCAALPELDGVVESFQRELAGRDLPPGPLSGAGVTVEAMAAFADAAARFDAAAPWRLLDTEDLLRIEAPADDPALRYACVMGSGGEQFGLLFFASPEAWESFGRGARPFGAGIWSVSLDPEVEAPLADLDLWDRHDWPRPGSGRVAVAARLGGERIERPDARKLVFFEGVLRALAASTEVEMDSGRWEKRVATFRGPARFVLSLPGLLEEEPASFPLAAPWLVSERLFMKVRNALSGREFSSDEEMKAAVDDVLAQSPSEPASPQERALDLAHAAWGARGRRRILLARQALELWPDCADAHLLLGHLAPDSESRLDRYAQAVAAGERALGPDLLEEPGELWDRSEARPYMRALSTLALELRALCRTEEAVRQLQILLRLDPRDPLDVWDLLVAALLELDQYDELEDLQTRFGDDGSADWAYTHALLAFAREGDTPEARARLQAALHRNPAVPKYLLGSSPLPDVPPSFKPRGEGEAVVYAEAFLESWEDRPGALSWLREQRAARRKSIKERRKVRKPGRRGR